MKENIAKMFNEQINRELFSEYLYMSFSNYFVADGLNGFANWFQIQSQEERDHAMLMVKFLQNNDEKVVYEAIEKPENSWAENLNVLIMGYEHEKYITESINKIYDVAAEEKDYRTTQFLDWFVKEQGEEEKNITEIIRKLELFGNDAKGLYMLDQELAARVYTPPTLVI